MLIKTKEKLQPQDNFTQEVYKKPTDKRLKGFKVGKLVQFIDRFDTIKGVVGGFSMDDIELVWIRNSEVKQHSRHRADEVVFLRELKIKKEKEVKIKIKKVVKKADVKVDIKKVVKKPKKK